MRRELVTNSLFYIRATPIDWTVASIQFLMFVDLVVCGIRGTGVNNGTGQSSRLSYVCLKGISTVSQKVRKGAGPSCNL